MPAIPLERSSRLERRLPLLIAGVLVLAVAGVTMAAYREVRAAALGAAEARLSDVAGSLADLLSSSVENLVSAADSLAADPALAEAIALPSPEASARAYALLERRTAASEDVRAVELWSTDGDLVTAAGSGEGDHSGSDLPFPALTVGDGFVVSAFRQEAGVVRYDVAARVADGGRTLGYVVFRRALSGASDDARRIESLIGSGATFRVGSAGGVWTDLGRAVQGPPDDIASQEALDRAAVYRHARDGPRMLGAGAPVRGAPWVAWVELSYDRVLERPRTFLARMLPLGLLVVGVGAVGGGVFSRRLTAALRSSEERFRALASTAPDAIITADEEGRVTLFNPGAERMFGRAESEIIGRELTEIMPARFREPHRSAIARWATAEPDTPLDRTVALAGLRADGSEFPLELALGVRWDEGRPVFTGIVRDVSERNRREEQIARYTAELEATNSELEAFSYSVSHDLRTPLRAIHGFSQAVLEGYRDRLDDQGVEDLRRVCAASERMGELIDDLLELSRATRDEMRMEEVDLSGLAEEAAERLAAAEPHREVDVRIGPALSARGDRRLLALVLDNLIGNAWKFTGDTHGAAIEVGAAERGVFFVRDNGAGFDMAHAAKLFDPFERLHSPGEFEGSGIGLALVSRIVRRHGGQVWGEGIVGEGATFHFTLPES